MKKRELTYVESLSKITVGMAAKLFWGVEASNPSGKYQPLNMVQSLTSQSGKQ